jgi:hypothetical protein
MIQGTPRSCSPATKCTQRVGSPATIAAAIVRHGAMITRQTPFALARAFEELAGDPDMPERIRDLGSLAADALGRMK